MKLRNPFGFFTEFLRQPPVVVVWVMFLMAINLSAAFFLHEPLAQLILAAFFIGAGLIMALYSVFGYRRILGLGHALWLFLVPYIALQLPSHAGVFLLYLIVLLATLVISLVLDIRDVYLALSGAEQATG